MFQAHERAGSAARGTTQLAFDAVAGITNIVEGMHANIAAAPSRFGKSGDGRTRGIAGLVYQTIRLVNRGTGWSVDAALLLIDKIAVTQPPVPQPRWDAVMSALNGVLGDHLFEHENPLAITMQLRRHGRPIQLEDANHGRKPLILIHGLCMNDRQWLHEGHDHGEQLAKDLGYTPLYLFYNSGRHISENGRDLANLLERFVGGSSEPIEELSIISHSMGGLVARSAYQIAVAQRHDWPRHVRKIVFLGTPHHGTPLERVGNWIHSMAEHSPYLGPLSALAFFRSAGITDLRHGNILNEDWENRHSESDHRDLRQPISLPKSVACYAIAGTLRSEENRPGLESLGDGLVPVESALGKHEDSTRALDFPESHQWIGVGKSHFDLLRHPDIYSVIQEWMSD